MNIPYKPIVISLIVIMALLTITGFINNTSIPAMITGEQNSKDQETFKNLENISKIEGQKITAITGSQIKLENGELIDFGTNPIKCEVGDIIENYTVANQSLVCVRKDKNGNTTSFIMPIVSGIAGGILGNYIASKLFANNNGLNRMPNSYDYRNNNGQVYNSRPAENTYTTSSQANRTSNQRTFGNGGFVNGMFGSTGSDNSNNTNQNNSGNTKNTGTTGGSKGGISTGSKGGSGGG